MKVKIEIDLTPSELRALIGLPDVAGLQEDMIEYLRDRVSHGVEGFDPAGFVRDNVQNSKAWKRLMAVARGEEEEAAKKPAKRKAATRSRSTKSTTTKRATTKKP